MAQLSDVLESCYDLDEKLSSNTDEYHEKILKHLEKIESSKPYVLHEIPEDAEWLNTSGALSLHGNLKGKLVVLDFFTYCCINCMHILPDLEALEEKFSVEDGVAVVGVHSAKFKNEKVSSNILSAILRYNIHHPVVNDRQAVLWKALQIACWPTLVIVGPDGRFLYQIIGEGHRARLLDFVGVAHQFYRGRGHLSNHSLPLSLATHPATPLSFPGKVCVSRDGEMVAISDTGHHRVIVTDSAGIVKFIIGGKGPGFKDGRFFDAEFSSPQGLAIHGNILYVADTNNHAIRKLDLSQQEVSTLAGTGSQGQDKVGGKLGTEQEISSPWDLCIADGLAGEESAVLMIAMAGTHQVWAYFLADAAWVKNSHMAAGTCVRFSGSGAEENRNNSYREKAGFAQPSGLTLSQKHQCLFVADSESSTIRRVQLKDGAVKNVVGGELDAMNLFAFGDVDGTGLEVKLQHPLGVTMATDGEDLYVADSYNHKIKLVDPVKRTCTTIMGSGHPGNTKGVNLPEYQLNEPGGLCYDSLNNRLYMADTNNCDIKVLDLEKKKVYSLPILFSEPPCEPVQPAVGIATTEVTTVILMVTTAEGVHLNREAPNSWSLYSKDDQMNQNLESSNVKLKGELTTDMKQILAELPTSIEGELCLKLDLFTCEDSGLCKMGKQVLKQKICQREVTFELLVS